jgi:hypothetical protein
MNHWSEFYKAAVLETDWTKVQERIQKAESEIQQKLSELSASGGTPKEKEALASAMNGLRILEVEAATWLEPKKLDGSSRDPGSHALG